MLFPRKPLLPLSFVLLTDGMVAVLHEDKQWIMPVATLLRTLQFTIEPSDSTTSQGSVFELLWRRYALRAAWLDESQNAHVVRLGPYTHNQALDARASLFQQLSLAASMLARHTTSKPRRKRSIVRWLAAAVVVAGGYSWLTTPTPADSPIALAPDVDGQASQASSPPNLAPSPAMAYSTPTVRADGALEPSGLKTLETLANKAGMTTLLALNDETQTIQPFYVFLRPGCSDCGPLRDIMEDKLGVQGVRFRPVLLPSGFQTDATGGEARAVSWAYCDVGPNWDPLFNSSMPDAFASCNWKEKAEVALLAGILSGAVDSDTTLPLIVAPNGAVHEGPITGDSPARALTEWLYVNRKLD